MSTLVKIVIGVVLNILQTGELPKEHGAISEAVIIECEYGVEQLNPHYIITSDEMLAQKN